MIIDLCCGIGRFKHPVEEVVSLDFNPVTKPTILCDIKHLPFREGLRPDLVHASPPCKYFSISRQRVYGHDHIGIAESLELVAACFKAFHYLKTRHWTLENPLGFLSRLFNEAKISYEVHDYTDKKTRFYTDMRSLRRAVIPDDVRQIILGEVYKDEMVP